MELASPYKSLVGITCLHSRQDVVNVLSLLCTDVVVSIYHLSV